MFKHLDIKIGELNLHKSFIVETLMSYQAQWLHEHVISFFIWNSSENPPITDHVGGITINPKGRLIFQTCDRKIVQLLEFDRIIH